MRAKNNVMDKTGRRTKLTPELQEKICAVIAMGNYIITACQACGIHESTYYRWLDEADKEGNTNQQEFSEAIKKAEAEAQSRHIKIIDDYAQSGKQGAWYASAWLLERKYPSEWALRPQIQRHELAGDIVVKLAIPERAYPELTTTGTKQIAKGKEDATEQSQG